MNDLDEIMKKVFKREFTYLDKFEAVFKQENLSESELTENYSRLLESYRTLLQDAVKITKIGDIHQKKLFDANEQLEAQKKLLYTASVTDSMTGVYNRNFLIRALKSEYANYERYQKVFSCIMIDIDDFKKINDNYGHQFGDVILAGSADIINNELREVDIFGRYGGEEFLIILPNTHAKKAELVAEKIRKKIAETIYDEKGNKISITISQGISDILIDNPKSEDELLYKVDTALYQAKQKGKNQSIVYQKNEQSTFLSSNK